MKGCLKTPGPCGQRTRQCKCVAFGAEGSEEVYPADVWDRTPAEPARQLSYEDLLELKEIQCSLPRANQHSDPVSGRPASHYLTAVPIALLPLLPPPPPPPPPSSPSAPPSTPHLQHRPPHRSKPLFPFLPLLDSPSLSNSTTPSLTNNTTSPSSSSSSPSIPPISRNPILNHHFGPSELDFISPAPSLYSQPESPPPASPTTRWSKWSPPEIVTQDLLVSTKPIQRRKHSFIVVNGVEIPIDDDEEENAKTRVNSPTSPRVTSPSITRVTSPITTTSRPKPTPSFPSTKRPVSPPPTPKQSIPPSQSHSTKQPTSSTPSSPTRITSPLSPTTNIKRAVPPSIPRPASTIIPRTSSPSLTRTSSPILTRTASPAPPSSCGRQSTSTSPSRSFNPHGRGPVVI
ncbi:hypothetical protein L208DRAFT_1390509 [Tricholoma matsutake]|nr:hypothetical protein L208DRAFT_1390509 [Tricholoma matsutake 945]